MRKTMKRRMSGTLAGFMTVAMAFPLLGQAGAVFAEEPDSIADAYKDEGYHLVWNDEFDGTELNTEDWNIEVHEAGWKDEQLQVYGDASNIEVSDGTLKLIPKAVKKELPATRVLEGTVFDAEWSGGKEGDGEGTVEVQDGTASVSVTDPGSVNSGVYLRRQNLSLIQGHKYFLRIAGVSDVDREVEVSVAEDGTGTVYGGTKALISAKGSEINYQFDYEGEDSDQITVQLNFGTIEDYEEESIAADLTFSSVEFIDLTGLYEHTFKSALRGNGFESGWSSYTQDGGVASFGPKDGEVTVNITNPGSVEFSVQYQQKNITLKKDHPYWVHFKASAAVDKAVKVGVMEDRTWHWFKGATNVVGTDEKEINVFFTSDIDSNAVCFQINLGMIEKYEDTSVATEVKLSDARFEDLSEEIDVFNPKKDYDFSSGYVTTEGKQDFLYGRYEAGIRVPAGQGYLPTFGLMAKEKEDGYGEWPLCGEIDIMEVLGKDVTTSFHTLHYGNPEHVEEQETVSGEVSYADEFHIFMLDWEPEGLTWYVDGEKVYEVNELIAGEVEENSFSYPAPFDKEFYVALNLAIGGTRAQDPDLNAVEDMENQQFEIDYVRVYQKDVPEEHFTGWKNTAEGWMYYIEDEAVTGEWQEIEGKNYYFDAKGIMASNEWVEGYWLNKNGSCTYPHKASWKHNAKGWWYSDTSGWYAKNSWQKIDGKWYYFKANGYMAANEYCKGYWLNKDGTWTYKAKASWKKNAIGWYYIDTKGWYAKSGTYTIDGKQYKFNAKGYCTNP